MNYLPILHIQNPTKTTMQAEINATNKSCSNMGSDEPAALMIST